MSQTPRKTRKKVENSLDTFSDKRGRGRPFKISGTEVAGRANNFRWILDQVWDRLWPLLSKAGTEDEVVKAFEEGADPYERNFTPHFSALTLQILRETNFPSRTKSQIGFLADSLAGVGQVTPRRSRDICAEQRVKAERAHHIIRYEYYVECSCGYSGNSRGHACPNCGTKIKFDYEVFRDPTVS